jgi:RNA polymerase sigma factor for flagellar operon FliA
MAVAGDLNLKEQIIKKYIPLVKYIASRVIIGKSKYIEFEDLIGYGMLGLMDAFNKFDESRGMKFSTYASIRIRGSMIDEIRKNSPISKGAMDKLNRYNNAIETLQKKNLKDPSGKEIAEELKVSLGEVGEIENFINYISVVSLEDLIFSEDDDMMLMGTIEDEKSPNPVKSLEEQEQVEYLTKALTMLNEKDKTVLTLYYYEAMTLKEIGKVLGVSESRVCQLHSRAIVHLKKMMNKLKYDI